MEIDEIIRGLNRWCIVDEPRNTPGYNRNFVSIQTDDADPMIIMGFGGVKHRFIAERIVDDHNQEIETITTQLKRLIKEQEAADE